VVAINRIVLRIRMRSARWLLCHNEFKHWRFPYRIDVL